MIENLLDSLNVLLLQHPQLIHLMQTLFWIKHWILMGIMGVFVYLVYTEARQEAPEVSNKPAPEGVFIA